MYSCYWYLHRYLVLEFTTLQFQIPWDNTRDCNFNPKGLKLQSYAAAAISGNHEGPPGSHSWDYNYVLCYWYSHPVLSTVNYYLFKWKKWTLRGTHCNYIATALRVPHVNTARYLPGTYYWNLLLKFSRAVLQL